MLSAGGTAQLHAFRKACQQGNIPLVQQIAQRGISIDAPQEDGCTALWLAAEAGQVEVVGLLCTYGANPMSIKTQGQVSCLYVAAQNGHLRVVESLLHSNANPDQAKDSGATPLFISSQQGNLEIVSTLLGGRADPDLGTKTGVTPLMIASYQGHAHIVRMLIAAGADPEKVGAGKTAAEWAASNNTLDLVRTVLRKPQPQVQQAQPRVPSPQRTPMPQPPMPPVKAQTPHKVHTPLKVQTSPRLTASVLPQQQPLYGIPSTYTEAQTAATPFTRGTLHEDLESPEKDAGPSRAYESAEPSLAKLFKIKDEPIDLEAGVRRELAKRAAKRQGSSSGGSDTSVKKPVAKRSKHVVEPDFIKKEKERAAQYQREARQFAETKKYTRPTNFFEEHLERNAPASSAWDDFKYKLASMEDELQKTSGSVADKWMFGTEELGRRRAVKGVADEDHATILRPSMSRVVPEVSPARKRREADEQRRAVLKLHNIPYQLDKEKVGQLAEVMGAVDPEEVQRKVAELAFLNTGKEEQPAEGSDDEGKRSHVSGVSDPPSIPSFKPPTPAVLVATPAAGTPAAPPSMSGSRPPSIPGTMSRHSSALSRLSEASKPSVAPPAAPPATPPSPDPNAGAVDSDDELLSQTSAALLARVASRRSSRSQGRAGSVASIPEP